MKIEWWRHKNTGTAHAFDEERRSMCLHAKFEDMGRRTSRGTMMRCKLCVKNLERTKKRKKKFRWR